MEEACVQIGEPPGQNKLVRWFLLAESTRHPPLGKVLYDHILIIHNNGLHYDISCMHTMHFDYVLSPLLSPVLLPLSLIPFILYSSLPSIFMSCFTFEWVLLGLLTETWVRSCLQKCGCLTSGSAIETKCLSFPQHPLAAHKSSRKVRVLPVFHDSIKECSQAKYCVYTDILRLHNIVTRTKMRSSLHPLHYS